MPITFSPATFTLHQHTYSDPVTPQHPTQVLTGFIPVNTYLSGTWRIRGSRSMSGNAATWTETLFTSSSTDVYATNNVGGAYDTSFAVSAACLAAINLAAGGNLSVTLQCAVGPTSGLTDAVNLVTLDLVPPPACAYALTPTSAHYTAAGGAGTFAVVTDVGCAWTALSNNPTWLHVTAGSPGTGNGTVSYTVDANPAPSPARVGTISVADQLFTVTEDGAAGTGTGGTSANFGYPYPHNAAHHLFMTIGFPNGYQPGLDIYVLYPGMDELQFITVRPRSGYIGKMTGRILVLTDEAGAEIATGTICGSVDIWRFRIV